MNEIISTWNIKEGSSRSSFFLFEQKQTRKISGFRFIKLWERFNQQMGGNIKWISAQIKTSHHNFESDESLDSFRRRFFTPKPANIYCRLSIWLQHHQCSHTKFNNPSRFCEKALNCFFRPFSSLSNNPFGRHKKSGKDCWKKFCR